MGKSIRTFLAIQIPDRILMAIKEEQETWKALGPGPRWVKPQLMHITLKFLGEISQSKVQEVIQVTQECVKGYKGFSLSLENKGVFPNFRRPRVFWIGVAGQIIPLATLHKELDNRLSVLGFPPEEREFRPHLTVARIKGPLRQGILTGFLSQELRLGSFEVSEVVVFKSVLSPKGPSYVPLAHCSFKDQN